MVIINIIVFIFVLGLVIIIHELGHFIMAKRANILCHEFSFGMGPLLWSKRVKETLYCIRAIPIGGYVMMAGEEISNEVVSVGQIVRLVFDEFNNVEKIILDHENEKYEEYESVTVTNIDLRGEDNNPLQLNEYTVKRNAFYVFKKSKELQIAPAERSFESKTKWQRFLAMFAGPFMNFVLAFVIFLIVNLIVGFPNMGGTVLGNIDAGYPAAEALESGDKVISINDIDVYSWNDISVTLDENPTDRSVEFVVLRDGITKTAYVTPMLFFYSIGFHSQEGVEDDLILGEVNNETIAGKAGIIENDEILTIDSIPMNSWDDLALVLNNNVNGVEMSIEVLRGTETMTFLVTPHNHDLVISQGLKIVDSYIGIGPIYEFGFFRSFLESGLDVKASAAMIFTTLDLLFSNDQVGIGDLAGPVGIYDITSRALSAGFISFLTWTALLSVNLGVINLLPIPALDGGRLVFLGYEAITKKKPNKRVENTLHYAMYLMLMGLFVYITFNDILRLFDIR
jgi:regulator of sigma E protease